MEIPKIVHESWHKHLQPLFDDPKMVLLKNKVIPSKPFYPDGDKIFRVFSMPLENIKVVILGQDPYPNGEAIGLAFAVKEDVAMPASLKIISTEVVNNASDRDTNYSVSSKKWRTLNHWFEQGVFLLNTALTVEAKKAASHLNYWDWFTREVIRIISENAKPVWLLWGAKAQGFREYIKDWIVPKGPDDLKDPDKNYILQCDHPAAEAYNGGASLTKFSGCNHFNRTNYILNFKKKGIILW
jgi:uracil-DNA glycosylase